METKAETKAYNFMYDDGKYFVFDLTDHDMTEMRRQMFANDRGWVSLSIGIIATKGLRFAVERVEEEPELQDATPPEYDMEMLMDMQNRKKFVDEDEYLEEID